MKAATLYIPQQLPVTVPLQELGLSTSTEGNMPAIDTVAHILGCSPSLVDVLASGSEYIAYSVFDYEGEVNETAMQVVQKTTGITFDLEDDDTILRGPILVIL